jgi:hypothetical protein
MLVKVIVEIVVKVWVALRWLLFKMVIYLLNKTNQVGLIIS